MGFASPHAAREMYSRAAWTIAFAVVVYFINRAEYPGPAATLAVVITLIGVALAGIGIAFSGSPLKAGRPYMPRSAAG